MASFARLYDTINEKEWFLRLKPEERCVYLQILAYSTKDRGCLHTSNSWVLSQKLMIDESLLTRAITKLIKIGRLELCGSKLIVSDYADYNPDPTNAKRQAEFKLRNQNKEDSVTGVTRVTVTNASNDNNAPEPEPEPEPITLTHKRAKPRNDDLVTKTVAEYNEHKPASWIECETAGPFIISQLSDQIPANKETWDLPKILAIARESSFLSAQIFDLGWLLQADAKRGGRLNWKRILGGEFGNKRSRKGGDKPPEQRAGHLTPTGHDF